MASALKHVQRAGKYHYVRFPGHDRPDGHDRPGHLNQVTSARRPGPIRLERPREGSRIFCISTRSGHPPQPSDLGLIGRLCFSDDHVVGHVRGAGLPLLGGSELVDEFEGRDIGEASVETGPSRRTV